MTTSRTMSILQSFERIQKVWYLIGLAPCHINAENRKDKNWFRRVPVVIFIMINISLTVLQYFSFYLKSYGLINELFYYIFYAVTLISNVTANWQCWHYGSTYQNIIHRVQLVENACKVKFAMKFSYGTIKRRYIVTALFVFGFYCLAAAVVLIQAWFIFSSENPNESILIALCTLFKDLMCVMAVLHFTLYVDIVRSFIAELNKQVSCWSPIHIHKPMRADFLKDVKIVHMDLFLLMKEINGFFGWHLLVLVIHYLVLIINQFFWIFMNLYNKGKIFSIAGELLTKMNESFSKAKMFCNFQKERFLLFIAVLLSEL